MQRNVQEQMLPFQKSKELWRFRTLKRSSTIETRNELPLNVTIVAISIFDRLSNQESALCYTATCLIEMHYWRNH